MFYARMLGFEWVQEYRLFKETTYKRIGLFSYEAILQFEDRNPKVVEKEDGTISFPFPSIHSLDCLF